MQGVSLQLFWNFTMVNMGLNTLMQRQNDRHFPDDIYPLSQTIILCVKVKHFIQYSARNRPWYSLRGLHICITWFSLYGIRIPLFSLYGIHMPLFPYMVILPIVLGVALLWAAMDSPLSQGPLLWRHNDMTVIVSPDTRGRERDTRQRFDNANARRLQTFNR